QNIEINLSPWQGSVARLRFSYYYSAETPGPGVSGYNFDNAPEAGWAIDDIQLINAPKLNESDRTNTQQTRYLTVNPPSADVHESYYQLRNYAFGGYALEWGPLHRLVFTDQEVPPLPQIRDGQWIWDPHFG